MSREYEDQGVYYNEWNEDAAEWLRALIAAGELPHGFVDTRSIRDVRPGDLVGYRQWHFFAGVGGWPLALRWAGLENMSGIVTGSPPCQPFSVAGKQLGERDERHLAPCWLDLVFAIRPELVVGEQVWAAVNRGWLDDLFERAEAEGYACGAAGIPAAGVGAPHQRERLFFGMADAYCGRWVKTGCDTSSYREANCQGTRDRIGNGSADEQSIGMDNADCERREIDSLLRGNQTGRNTREDPEVAGAGATIWMADTKTQRSSCRREGAIQPITGGSEHDLRMAEANRGERYGVTDGQGRLSDGSSAGREQSHGFAQSCGDVGSTSPPMPGWDDPDWLLCRDGKWRPVESGSFPLADGLSKIVGPCSDPSSYLDQHPQAWRTQRLKGYGNAIVPQIGAEFVEAFIDALHDRESPLSELPCETKHDNPCW